MSAILVKWNKMGADLKEIWKEGDNKNITQEIHLGGITICPSAPQSRPQKYLTGEVVVEHVSDNQVADYAPASSLNPTAEVDPPNVYNGLEIRGLATLYGDPIRTDVRGEYSADRPEWQGLLQLAPDIKQANVRVASMKDGASTTFMFFEVAGRPEHNASGRPVPSEQAIPITSFRWASPTLPISIGNTCRRASMMNCHNSDEIYAFHPGGAFITFADGSVHFVQQDIDPETFVSLYTIAGGDVVNDSEIGL